MEHIRVDMPNGLLYVYGDVVTFSPDKSSSINWVRWDNDHMSVEFTSSKGFFYLYKGVPFGYMKRLVESESVGSYFAKNIKPYFEFEKIG
jgi:hypothetical protein